MRRVTELSWNDDQSCSQDREQARD
jgi:hypothetical protein